MNVPDFPLAKWDCQKELMNIAWLSSVTFKRRNWT